VAKNAALTVTIDTGLPQVPVDLNDFSPRGSRDQAIGPVSCQSRQTRGLPPGPDCRDTQGIPEDQANAGKPGPGRFEKRATTVGFVKTVLVRMPRWEGLRDTSALWRLDDGRCLGTLQERLIKSAARQCDPSWGGASWLWTAWLDAGFPQRLMSLLHCLVCHGPQEGGGADALQPFADSSSLMRPKWPIPDRGQNFPH